MPTQIRAVADRTVRTTHIASAIASPTGTLRVPFRGGFRDLPAGKIHHEHLLFRLDNGRTLGEQRQVIVERSLPADQFVDDANPQAQALQEEILWAMAEIKDLMKVLKQNGQTEPLLVMPDGVIINGNRRLATMRRIIAEGHKLPHWPYVEIAALPADTNQQDILDIEARLQLVADVRADYAWYDRALLYERARSVGTSDADIVTMYHVPDGTKEVNELIRMLNLARDFLASIGKQDAYGQLEKHYYAFRQLRDTIDAEPDPSRRLLVQELGFRHLRTIAKAGRRYETMPGIRKHLDAITNRIVAEAKIAPPPAPAPVVASLLGAQPAPAQAPQQTALIQALRANQVPADVVAACIDEVINEEERKLQDRQRLGALDEALSLAVDALIRAAAQVVPNSASQVTTRSAALIADVVTRASQVQAQVQARLQSAPTP